MTSMTSTGTCAVGAVTVTPPAETLQLGGAKISMRRGKRSIGLPLTTSDSVAWAIDSTLASVSPNVASSRVTRQHCRTASEGTARDRDVGHHHRRRQREGHVHAAGCLCVDAQGDRVHLARTGRSRFPIRPFRCDLDDDLCLRDARRFNIFSGDLPEECDGVEFGYEVPVNQEFSYFECNVYIGGFSFPTRSTCPPHHIVWWLRIHMVLSPR